MKIEFIGFFVVMHNIKKGCHGFDYLFDAKLVEN